ncbi:MAG: sugar ABC transporter permease [Anaerolineae bacterium]|nr:sugar ABC transporter permease [Anaerolineae bacterium]
MVAKNASPSSRSSKFSAYIARTLPLYIMILPGLVLLILFSYFPIYGVALAFQKFNPGLGVAKSPWVGLDNFRYLFNLPDFWRITRNTLIIAVSKTISLQVCAILLALMLNEIRSRIFKRSIQTIVYLPHFLSWVILGGLMLDLLSSTGLVNQMLRQLGNKPIIFLGSNDWFRPVLVVTYLWQEVGWSAIIYLAALTGIDPVLYEAANIDGASHLRQIQHVTLPGIRSTVLLVAILSLGSMLDAGFDQVLNLYNPVVYPTGDILDTYIYRAGLVSAQFSLATAVGLFRSIVRLILVAIGYWLADRYSDYRIF